MSSPQRKADRSKGVRTGVAMDHYRNLCAEALPQRLVLSGVMMVKSAVLVFFLATLLQSCADNSAPDIEQLVSSTEFSEDRDISSLTDKDRISEFILEHPKRSFTLSPDVQVDYTNFMYDDFILHNGVSYSDVEMGFDTIRHVKTHSFGDSLRLIELYEYYGGGSSEILKLIYLYRRERSALVLLSKLTAYGNYPTVVDGNRIKVRTDNYKGGEYARSVPWKIEVGEFEVTDSGLSFVGNDFEDIPE